MKKQNKGITLIALVITIIVLLILAGVSIATLTGENGLLAKAGNAKEEQAIAQAKEEIDLALNTLTIEERIAASTLADDKRIEIVTNDLKKSIF